VGATTGNNGRTEGLPEVQKPVLEHAPTEEEITRGGDVVNLVTSVTEIRKTDVKRVPFIYEVKSDAWENPEKIRGVTVHLPDGRVAWFCRMDEWELRPYKPLTA
jgi:hypothetical protein